MYGRLEGAMAGEPCRRHRVRLRALLLALRCVIYLPLLFQIDVQALGRLGNGLHWCQRSCQNFLGVIFGNGTSKGYERFLDTVSSYSMSITVYPVVLMRLTKVLSGSDEAWAGSHKRSHILTLPRTFMATVTPLFLAHATAVDMNSLDF